MVGGPLPTGLIEQESDAQEQAAVFSGPELPQLQIWYNLAVGFLSLPSARTLMEGSWQRVILSEVQMRHLGFHAQALTHRRFLLRAQLESF